jgi:predicted nucleic acid-binding protein
VNYLIDTSALTRAPRQPTVGLRIRQIPLDQRFTCLPIILEMGVSAQNAREHATWINSIVPGSQRVYLTPDVENRAIQMQGLLVAKGQHRSAKLSDLVIAAAAEVAGLTVLHYDSDFDLIADVTGQPTEWAVPRGSVS